MQEEFMRRMRLSPEMRADEEEQANFAAYIASGKEYLRAIACCQNIDFISDKLANDLLYNWCFYARADCTEKFEQAYRPMLLQLRLRASAGKVITIPEDDAEGATDETN